MKSLNVSIQGDAVEEDYGSLCSSLRACMWNSKNATIKLKYSVGYKVIQPFESVKLIPKLCYMTCIL